MHLFTLLCDSTVPPYVVSWVPFPAPVILGLVSDLIWTQNVSKYNSSRSFKYVWVFQLGLSSSWHHGEKSTLCIAIGLRMERHVGRLELNLWPKAKPSWGQSSPAEPTFNLQIWEWGEKNDIYSFKPLRYRGILLCSITIANLINKFSDEFPSMFYWKCHFILFS